MELVNNLDNQIILIIIVTVLDKLIKFNRVTLSHKITIIKPIHKPNLDNKIHNKIQVHFLILVLIIINK
jgi:hypothetical protein